MVSSGVTVRGLGVITSRIFMGSPLSALAGGYLALFLSKSKAPPAEPYNRFVARAAVFVGVAALVVFAVVQDRLTVAGVGQYIAASRDAAAGRRPSVTIDEVMQPAVMHAVRQGT